MEGHSFTWPQDPDVRDVRAEPAARDRRQRVGRGEAADPQDVQEVLRPVKPGFADLNRVCAGRSEFVLEPGVEQQTRVVVVLGDELAGGSAEHGKLEPPTQSGRGT